MPNPPGAAKSRRDIPNARRGQEEGTRPWVYGPGPCNILPAVREDGLQIQHGEVGYAVGIFVERTPAATLARRTTAPDMRPIRTKGGIELRLREVKCGPGPPFCHARATSVAALWDLKFVGTGITATL